MDYEKLFKEAVYHLRCVSGSRNSFHPDVRSALQDKGIMLERTVVVENLHRDANRFLNEYDK